MADAVADTHSVAYHRLYGAAWAAWILVTLGAEFLGYGWLWALAAVGFALAEGLAIRRKSKGDTWSELVWAFYKGEPSRIFLIVGWVGWIGLRLLGFGGVDVTLWGHDAARIFLVGGIVGWLLIHFLARGKYG